MHAHYQAGLINQNLIPQRYTCGMYCITRMQKDGLATIVAIPSMAVAEMLVARPNQIA